MSVSRRVLLALVLLFPAAARADVTSGPAAGDPVAALKVFAATGAIENQEVDYAAERKEKPTVYILLQYDKLDRPMGRFLKTLDEAVKKDFAGAYVVTVWLAEDKDKAKEHLPRINQSLKFEATAMTVFLGGKEGPKDWNVNPDAHVTVVVANQRKVAATFAYLSLNETDVPRVQEALKKAVNK
jgi:hypothetical protein